MKLVPSVLTAASLPSVCTVPKKSVVISYWVLFFVHSVLSVHERIWKSMFAWKVFFMVNC